MRQFRSYSRIFMKFGDYSRNLFNIFGGGFTFPDHVFKHAFSRQSFHLDGIINYLAMAFKPYPLLSG